MRGNERVDEKSVRVEVVLLLLRWLVGEERPFYSRYCCMVSFTF
jgi:hypothetical protein